MPVVSFGHGQNPILGRRLIGNWIFGGPDLGGIFVRLQKQAGF
jgi:hypothetical protein